MASAMTSTDQSRGTVLVTGGAGYIGSHACKALARAGYLPIIEASMFAAAFSVT